MFRIKRVLLTLAALSTLAQAAQAQSFTQALVGGKPIVDLRARYEDVDDASKSPTNGEAGTFRARLGYETGDWNGLSLLAEFDQIWLLGGAYNSTRNGKALYPASQQSDRAEVMKYHTDLPALHTLARNFTVCDKWFSSVPGPTWTNRFFVHSGTSIGRVEMPNGILDANLHWYDQITLYDRLNERRKPWTIYYGDIPQSLMLVNQLEPHNACNYKKMIQFYQDVAQHPDSAFPAYCFIEPSYYEPGANDDHPTHDVAAGDRLIANVYNALRANEELWSKSLLIVLYDEHGGFYDHVVPPTTIAPDHHQEEYSFNQLGLRVPAILVSPYTAKTVVNTTFDHTSLLRYLVDNWSLGPLGARTAQANSFASAIQSKARSDCPKTLPLSGPPNTGQPVAAGRPTLSSHQTALFSMTQLLESMTDVAGDALRGRVARMIVGFDGAVDVGMQRVEEFLGQSRN